MGLLVQADLGSAPLPPRPLAVEGLTGDKAVGRPPVAREVARRALRRRRPPGTPAAPARRPVARPRDGEGGSVAEVGPEAGAGERAPSAGAGAGGVPRSAILVGGALVAVVAPGPARPRAGPPLVVGPPVMVVEVARL